MRIVVRDRRHRRGMSFYTFDERIDYRAVPDNLPLSPKVLQQYSKTKNNIGYTSFRGLKLSDIETILSAVKRQEAHVNVDRMGNCAFYYLNK